MMTMEEKTRMNSRHRQSHRMRHIRQKSMRASNPAATPAGRTKEKKRTGCTKCKNGVIRVEAIAQNTLWVIKYTHFLMRCYFIAQYKAHYWASSWLLYSNASREFLIKWHRSCNGNFYFPINFQEILLFMQSTWLRFIETGWAQGSALWSLMDPQLVARIAEQWASIAYTFPRISRLVSSHGTK